jgi:hypothetical protein
MKLSQAVPVNKGVFIAYLLTYLIMELSASWEAANCAATQEIPSVLWNPKGHYRLHKSPPLVPTLSCFLSYNKNKYL